MPAASRLCRTRAYELGRGHFTAVPRSVVAAAPMIRSASCWSISRSATSCLAAVLIVFLAAFWRPPKKEPVVP